MKYLGLGIQRDLVKCLTILLGLIVVPYIFFEICKASADEFQFFDNTADRICKKKEQSVVSQFDFVFGCPPLFVKHKVQLYLICRFRD